MKNDFLQYKIKKESKLIKIFSLAKYLIPFFVLLFIDIIYILFQFNVPVKTVNYFISVFSSIILLLSNIYVLVSSVKKNNLDKIKLLKESIPKLKINIEAIVHGNDVILKCQVQNISKVDFSLENCYVYIDSGIYNAKTKEYEFPFLQNKNVEFMEKSETDCIAGFYCKNKLCHYPESLTTSNASQSELNYKCYNLNHLSLESLAYIGSDESFNQEIIIHLEKGIYRALMVAIPDDSCDCKCYSVCFIID